MTWEALSVGQAVERERIVSAADVETFAEVTGDTNPIHLDEEFARGTRFGGRIAHGILVAGLISAVIAADLPGPGSIYVGQSLRFLAPVRLGAAVVVRVEIVRLDLGRRRAWLRTTARVGEVQVLDGEAEIYLP